MGIEDRQSEVNEEVETEMKKITDTAVLSSAQELFDEYNEMFATGYEDDNDDMAEEALELLSEMAFELRRNNS